MSYTTISCVTIRCDRCGRPLEFDTDDTALYRTELEAAAAAIRCGWEVTDGFHWCESCAEVRTRRGVTAGGTN